MEMECIIMSLIYIERLTKETRGSVQVEWLHRRLLLAWLTPRLFFNASTGEGAQLEESAAVGDDHVLESVGRPLHVERRLLASVPLVQLEAHQRARTGEVYIMTVACTFPHFLSFP